MKDLIEIKPIAKNVALEMISKYHYSKVIPKLNKLFLGGFIDNKLVGITTLGWGVRPVHTIKKLFPSLSSKDYWEIGKMCFIENSPKNFGSQFLSGVLNYVKQNFKDIKLIFTWADGMLGKCGYVYQATGFLYGGFIETDTYLTDEGEKVHPRQTGRLGGRPNRELMESLHWKHYKGKQFRYCYFTCDKREKKRLLKESTVSWGQMNMPKSEALTWRKQNNDKWEVCEKLNYNGKIQSYYLKENDKQEAMF